MNHWTAYDRWEQRMTLSPETRDAVREGCKRSAAAVLPAVFDSLGIPEALLDVGAGEGWWSRAAEDAGVRVVHAVDVDTTSGFCARWDAEALDPLPLFPDGRWPLALCLEMAEHVTPAAGDHLVAELCRVADQVVWSAAVPGQGGDGHINEQWPDYWAERFERHGYHLDDPWRLDLWDHPDVEPWYAQNLLCAYQGGNLRAVARPPLALVHPVTWAHHRGVPGPRSQ